jgi:hypothetical protein
MTGSLGSLAIALALFTGYARIGAALVLYLVILFAHEHVIGFSALAG